MQEVFETVFDLSMIVFVVGSMITVGLGLSISKIAEPFKILKWLRLP